MLDTSVRLTSKKLSVELLINNENRDQWLNVDASLALTCFDQVLGFRSKVQHIDHQDTAFRSSSGSRKLGKTETILEGTHSRLVSQEEKKMFCRGSTCCFIF